MNDKFLQPHHAIQFVRHEWTADELAAFRRRIMNGEDPETVATEMARAEVAREQEFEEEK
jgi:hypothetical protein